MAGRLTDRGAPFAGVLAGPFAWGANTQLGLALAPWACRNGIDPTPLVAVLLALVAGAGGWLSWRAFQAGPGLDEDGPGEMPRPLPFMALAGMAMAGLFALVTLTQGLAGLFLGGCER
ncbi:hypothetical protein [Prosthecomicrobium sp. N25]|uniref:hypothetical protein n=1 Tax=Prosthecomicrobium sp. N25 TaxID=3129254 RepID=UPI00307895A8